MPTLNIYLPDKESAEEINKARRYLSYYKDQSLSKAVVEMCRKINKKYEDK